MEQKEIKGIGKVYPCGCGQYPIWGAFFLVCPNFCGGMESEYDKPRGNSVRSWNSLIENRAKNKRKRKACIHTMGKIPACGESNNCTKCKDYIKRGSKNA